MVTRLSEASGKVANREVRIEVSQKRVTSLSKASGKVANREVRIEVSQTAQLVLTNTNWIRGYEVG